MSPEKLILKYIDGELNPAEDELLRKFIRDDSDAKELFDSYVELHASMQEDARTITVPQNLFDETEDLVMMRILEEEPSYAAAVSEKISESKFSKLLSLLSVSNLNLLANTFSARPLAAGVAMVLFIVSTIVINDGKLPIMPIADNSEVKMNTENSEIQNIEEKITSSKQIKSQSVAKKSEEPPTTFVSDSKIEESQTAFVNSTIVNESTEKTFNIEEDVNSINKEVPAANEDKLMNAIDLINMPANSSTPKDVSQFNNSMVSDILALTNPESPLNFNQVQITSFAGQDYFRQGINASNKESFSNFSQSISYSANEQNRFGLEFGYMEFEMYKEVYLSLPNQLLVLMPNDLGMDAGPVTTKVPVRLFWGSAFYERTILDYRGFSLNGRIGAGASAGGPVAYLRLFARQRIISGIYLTIGSEGKIFRTDHPLFDSNKMNTVGTLMYGLQFAF